MRTIFMGTPEFSVPSLEALCACEGVEPVGVLTQPDAPSRRGKRLVPSPVRACAEARGLSVFIPQTLKDDEAAGLVADLAPELIVVVSYGNILPARILEMPRLGCINVHASLLPRWRGAAPIERAILSGDEVTGVSIMRMEEGLDTGPYCAQTCVPIGPLSAPELTAELARCGAELLVKALPSIERGEALWTAQDEALSTYAAKIEKREMLLEPRLSAHGNELRVRSSTEHAPARAVICERQVTVLRAQALTGDELAAIGESIAAGEVRWARKQLLLGTVEGALRVLSLKPDGKKEMDAAGFANGVHGSLQEGTATWEALV